jgi:glycosyltransferase involved in cell wall biosynthesis
MTRTQFSRDWERNVLRVADELVDDVDLVYGSLVPYEGALAAPALAARLGKPWVADLQDPWALDEMCLYPSRIHRRVDLARMTRLLSTASAVVMNTPEAVRRVRRSLPELKTTPVVSIPNGFDPILFERLEATATSRDDGKFRIVHTGYLHTDLGRRVRRTNRARRLLGGMLIPIDILTRSHVFLLQALERLGKGSPELRSLVEVHLAGIASASDRAFPTDADAAIFHGYLPHQESVALLLSADLLFLPMHNLPPDTRAGIVPGKTYEYLRSGTPILAAVPAGDAHDLLSRSVNAHLCRPDDIDGMARVIELRVRSWLESPQPASPDPELWAPYEHPHLTARLAHLFDDVLGANTARVAVATNND